jgi:osmotically inducible lipoprotein OsmB
LHLPIIDGTFADLTRFCCVKFCSGGASLPVRKRHEKLGNVMKKVFVFAMLSALAIPVVANAQDKERAVTGAAIGAGAGAVVAGPPGAVVGGVAGAVIGGPRITHRRSCWRDNFGNRHCHRR